VKSGWEHGTPDTCAWDQWLAAHIPALLLFARQQTRCEADAQDVLQEAAVECWQRGADGRAPASAMVFATIRRRAIDLARSNQRRANRETAATGEFSEAWFDSGIEERERSRLLQEAMKSLAPIHRDVITLKVWGGLTFEEIAATLDIPANTAASRYRYGLEELRKLTKEAFA
jgi:RNA polymerase sigma-70 factor (ECF subfamily)